MIIGQEMAEIRHGGGGAERSHFWSLCGVAGFLETARWPKKFQYLRALILVAGSKRGVEISFFPSHAKITKVGLQLHFRWLTRTQEIVK